MKRQNLVAAGILTLALALRASLAADQPDLAIAVSGSKPHAWTIDQLKTDFAKETKPIKYTAKNVDHTAAGVPLIALINACAPAIDAKTKSDELRMVVIIEGRDGYIATFTLADLMPEIGKQDAWVAWEMDGKPLTDASLPATLIVPGDQKPERFVKGIKSVTVIDVTKITPPK